MKKERIREQSVEVGNLAINVQVAWSFENDGGEDWDLDLLVFSLAANGRVPEESYFVFYNNPASPDRSIVLLGDNIDQSGQVDEIVRVDLTRVDVRVQEIAFVLSIYEFEQRRQGFDWLRGGFIEILDVSKATSLVRYEFEEQFSSEGFVELGRLSRNGEGWVFRFTGTGIVGDAQSLIGRYC